MALNQAQMTALKAAILANSDVAALAGGAGNNVGVAAIFNAPHATTKLWQDISVQRALKAIDWSEYATLSAGASNAFLALTQGTIIEATDAAIRTAFGAIFSGKPNTIAALSAAAQRPATLAEDLFKGAQAGAAFNAGWTGQLSHTDIGEALLKG